MGLRIERSDPDSPTARALLDALSETLAALTGDSGRSSFDASDVRGAGAAFVVAHSATGEAIGCGAYRPLQTGVAELKRMYAHSTGAGVGSALLAHLEQAAQADGYCEIWLETRRVNTRAVAFYLRHGYHEIANFGRYLGRPEAICLARTLTAETVRRQS
ncbi:GNAT family N-acetyltransferase [Niveibacterium terrae]|uniref:GNAT family N-acetyltransferase n=1 Tax=Niveibacterium terrae TaxID=3373598 RepID=UPI003A8E0688